MWKAPKLGLDRGQDYRETGCLTLPRETDDRPSS